MLTIYDANNYVRRQFEVGKSVSDVFHQITAGSARPIVVWDGYGANAHRREIYPDYKKGRKPAGENIYENFKLLGALLELSDAIQIKVDGWEADDVIYSLCMDLDGEPVRVHSTDLDLAAIPNLVTDREKFPVDRNEIPLYKACVGDKSDNIPGIKGFGQKTWENLSPIDREMLGALLSGEELNPDDINMPAAPKNWIKENLELARAYFQVVALQYVPSDEVDKGTIYGKANYAEATRIMKDFLL